MRRLFVFVTALFVGISVLGSAVFADSSVRGYTRKDGTYVAPYTRSSPNKSYNDNWGVQGNTNPRTGAPGTQSPTFNDRTPNYNRQHYGTPGYLNQGTGSGNRRY